MVGQITLTPTQDVYISEYYPYQNFALSEVLFVGRFSQEKDAYRTLLFFDLSELDIIIPPSCEIDSAWLEFCIIRNEIPKDNVKAIEIYRIMEDWDGNTVKWDNQPRFYNIPEIVYNISFQEQGIKRIVITNLVKGWIKDLLPNKGILIRGDEDSNCLIAFRSKNKSEVTAWPKMIISYKPKKIKTYPELTLKVPALGWIYSEPIETEPAKQVTFLVRNIGKGEVNALIELSDDGLHWESTDVVSGSIVRDVGVESLTINAGARYARLAFKSKEDSVVIMSAAARS